MSEFNLDKFKENIIMKTHLLLVKEYGYSRDEATQMINDSKLSESIERNPLLFAHMTPEQVLDGVFN